MVLVFVFSLKVDNKDTSRNYLKLEMGSTPLLDLGVLKLEMGSTPLLDLGALKLEMGSTPLLDLGALDRLVAGLRTDNITSASA